MRRFSILSALVLAALFLAPLTHIAWTQTEQDQQATAPDNESAANPPIATFGASPYGTAQPTVGGW
jgi:hypothetical protein